MVNVKMENLVEIECPNLNERIMKLNKSTFSPGLKVQIFLNEFSADYHFAGAEMNGQRTRIICKANDNGRCLYGDGSTCLYNEITKNSSR